jgi:hypothetical protein
MCNCILVPFLLREIKWPCLEKEPPFPEFPEQTSMQQAYPHHSTQFLLNFTTDLVHWMKKHRSCISIRLSQHKSVTVPSTNLTPNMRMTRISSKTFLSACPELIASPPHPTYVAFGANDDPATTPQGFLDRKSPCVLPLHSPFNQPGQLSRQSPPFAGRERKYSTIIV